MKHVFVINPHAGGCDRSDGIAARLDTAELDYEAYATRAPRDATRFVVEWCAQHPADDVRFYACGGDGTLNEVVSGVMACGQAGSPVSRVVEVACYPCGSGNDYVRCWPELDFADLEALVVGSAVDVDVLRVGDRYAVNVLNYGFEAEVCRVMQQVRRWPLVGGRAAYLTGIVHCLFHARHNPCRIIVDGEAMAEGDMLLASAAIGRYVGGGYMCAPRAVADDGMLEAQCVDSLSIVRFARMIGAYKRGEHLDRADMADVVHYRRGRTMCIESDRPFSIVVDGELLSGNRFDIECMPRALKFVLPGGKV